MQASFCSTSSWDAIIMLLALPCPCFLAVPADISNGQPTLGGCEEARLLGLPKT